MKLITPTEREGRLALRDSNSGLAVVAEALREQAQAENVIVTLGTEGILLHAKNSEEWITDRLPAFNTAPKDPAGAGDCLLTCTAMALCSGMDIWQSVYLGSIAAACQVARVGNTPLTQVELISENMIIASACGLYCSAAGLRTRLRPLTDKIPKCLVPIHGKPLLDYWLDLLLGSGIERVLVNTHYLPDAVREFVAFSPWQARISLVHEQQLLGTAGTILHNSAYFKEGAFLVAHADNLTRFDVNSFLERHKQRPAGVEITMMTFDTDAPQTCGIVEEDERGIVQRLL